MKKEELVAKGLTEEQAKTCLLYTSHRKQVNDGVNWKCGVACLEMIFEYYGIEYDSDDIWEKIKTPRPNTWNHFYAHTHLSLIHIFMKSALSR